LALPRRALAGEGKALEGKVLAARCAELARDGAPPAKREQEEVGSEPHVCALTSYAVDAVLAGIARLQQVDLAADGLFALTSAQDAAAAAVARRRNGGADSLAAV
jgi:hypothetical protein